MTSASLLTALKVDLGITSTAYDTRLTAYLDNAMAQIRREGVTLTDQIDDQQLVIMYAAWTWRRRDTGEGMPRMVRYALNNRVLQEKING